MDLLRNVILLNILIVQVDLQLAFQVIFLINNSLWPLKMIQDAQGKWDSRGKQKTRPRQETRNKKNWKIASGMKRWMQTKPTVYLYSTISFFVAFLPTCLLKYFFFNLSSKIFFGSFIYRVLYQKLNFKAWLLLLYNQALS